MEVLTKSNHSSKKEAASVWLLIFCTAVCLVPFGNIIHILVHNGVNNLTNDTLLVLPWLDRLGNGSLDWSEFFRGNFINGHFQLFTLAIHYLDAVYADYNIFILLALGVVFALLRICFLYKCFTIINPYLRCLLLMTLFSLTFSTSQISTFEFEWNSVMVNLSFLGFAAGIYGLIRFSNSWRGIFVMTVGGVIAGWTSASGAMAWITFFLGMLLSGYRGKKFYIFWLLSGMIIFSPYIAYLFVEPTQNPYSTLVAKFDFFRLKFLVEGIGYPMSQGFSQLESLVKGGVALLLLLIVITVTIVNRKVKELLERSVPAILLLSFSLLTLWQVSVFRKDLVPFYTAYLMIFWLGLAGLSLVIIDAYLSSGRASWRWGNLGIICSISAALFVGYSYLSSNLTFEDKSATLKTRSPVSVSCLRYYRNSPTYCENTVFNWYLQAYDEFRKLSALLEKHRWSVFAPHQQWYLQGDFLLDNVKVRSGPGALPVFWIAGTDVKAVPVVGFRHLNLFLQSPNDLEWSIALPKSLKHAKLLTAVAASNSMSRAESSLGTGFEIIAVRDQAKPITLFQRHLSLGEPAWIPVEISLDRFAGQEVSLRFSVIPGNDGHAGGLFRFPTIELELNGAANEEVVEQAGFHPSNTDLALAKRNPSVSDYVFDVGDPEAWAMIRMLPAGKSERRKDIWTVEDDPIMEYKKEIRVPLAEYSHWYVKMRTTSGWKNRVAQIYYRLEGQSGFNEAQSVKIPLISDGLEHEYTLDLKLISLPSDAKLVGVRLDPVLNKSGRANEDVVQVLDFRLLKKTDLALSQYRDAP